MIKGIYTSAEGMNARILQQEAVSNNLANANTTAFKADRVLFSDAIRDRDRMGKYSDQVSVRGPDVCYVHTDFSLGPLEETRNPLDLAIAGRGFLVVETGDGVAYTRDGSLTLNEDNELVNSRGHKVLGETGPLCVTGSEVTVTPSGEILVEGASVGRLRLVDFTASERLRRDKNGYFKPAPGEEPMPVEGVRIVQGKLEKSNVNPVAEMIRMIELNRIFETCQKAIHAQDETLKLAVNEVGK